MAIFNRWSLTKKGIKLITKAQAGKCDIHFTKLETGNGAWSAAEDMQAATALKAMKQSFAFSRIDIPDGNPSTVVLEAVINNLELAELYYLREMGVFATDPDDGDILYAIALSDTDTTYIPANNGVGVSTITERINIEVANAPNVTIETTGAVVAASDFLAIKEKVDGITDGIGGGKTGQHLVKLSEEDYDFNWTDFKPVIVDKRANFPETGEDDAVYIDKATSSVYVWDSTAKSYTKLALGADAAENLQEQITANKEAIAASDTKITKLNKAVFSELEFTLSKDAWNGEAEGSVMVYTNEIVVEGITEDTEITLWPSVTSTEAADIVEEMKALSVLFGKGRAYINEPYLVFKCYGKKPAVDVGIRLQGMEI